ncbi:MAG: autotransporter-associated beta strand repeat-containing protein [Rhodanobacteraceae bacterium]
MAKDDSGTLVLDGANTYTGGTTIDSGTLQIGNGATNGSIVGDVANHGSLVFGCPSQCAVVAFRRRHQRANRNRGLVR